MTTKLLFPVLSRRFCDGVKQFDLISPGDHILVGLSGGKDSMALLELLGHFCRRHNHNFQVTALHVRMSNVNYQSDTTYLADFSSMAGATFLSETVSFETDTRAKRSPCFLCSWTRRKCLFETAQRLGCNKIALGHHADDILRTALMNLTFSGSFSTMPARLSMRKMPLTIIRPLCKIKEKELMDLAVERNYRPVDKVCEFDNHSQRTSISEVFDAMERLNPEARYSLWHALEKSGVLMEASGDGIP